MKPASNLSEADPWRHIQIATNQHRAEHCCWAYPHSDGRLLSVLVAAIAAKRVLELGTALGYTALSLAHGARDVHVDSLERDPEHVALARANVAKAGLADRIVVHEGEFAALLPTMTPAYDLAFFDGYAPALSDLREISRLLRPGGVLLSANQQHSGQETDGYRAHLRDKRWWLSAPLGEDSDMTLSVRHAFDSNLHWTK